MNADVSLSEQLSKIIVGEADSLFAAEAQQIEREHEHESPKLRNPGLIIFIWYVGGVMAFLPLNELPALFPHVVDWISSLEKQARKSGRALAPIEFNLAQHVGVAHPEEVRILPVPRVPLPAHLRVKQLAKQVGLLNADTAGLTAGYGVIVRMDCADNLRLLAHEFVHVAQYERLGREGFLQEYIQQIAEHGYLNAPFEQEAKVKSRSAAIPHFFR